MVNSKPTIKQASDARLKGAEATLERAREAERVRRGVEAAVASKNARVEAKRQRREARLKRAATLKTAREIGQLQREAQRKWADANAEKAQEADLRKREARAVAELERVREDIRRLQAKREAARCCEPWLTEDEYIASQGYKTKSSTTR